MNTILENNLMLPYQFVILTKDKTSSNELSKMEILSYAEFVSISAQIKPAITFFIMNTPLDVEWVAHFRPMSESFYVITINDMINPYKYQHAADGVIDLQEEQLPDFYQAISSIFINSGLINIGKKDAINCLEQHISHLYSAELSVNHLEIELDQFVSKHEQNLAEATNLLIVLTTDTSLTLEQFALITEKIGETASNAQNIVVGTGLDVEQVENVFLVDVLAGK
ncbi:Uncharacterised protein [Canicola haemoglobinophilus]|uniref:Uncharacterized protein n=1 Tax=Canicola haemoglobinophilus TaxID=733 RepID=A0AB38HAL1_9PAST|nr:hypothetical protein [Canicola haemoglobinophilus]STO55092.1 Uncharacterised protein [Canicola haemoglobinophilus]STO69337.1 Uncharacterised protein [Canicola haemoglobinophilus]